MDRDQPGEHLSSGDFERLVAPLRGELTAHCYRLLGSVHDAEDAVQESLVRAWKALPRLDDRGAVRPWMYKIATNRCLTMIEGRRRRALPMDLGPSAPLVETAWLEPYPDSVASAAVPGPEARYDGLESMELAFVAVLQHLPARQRAVLVLRDAMGFTARETAALLDISVPAANSSLQRARASVDQGLPGHTQRNALEELGADGVRRLAARYARAWEDGDVDAIVSMLSADAKYAMPPEPRWYQGRREIREFLLDGPLMSSWRFLPAAANGQITFGTYIADPDRGTHVACAVDLLAVRGGEITEVVSFLDASMFPILGLPMEITDDPLTDHFGGADDLASSPGL